jgi:hypothetical protein
MSNPAHLEIDAGAVPIRDVSDRLGGFVQYAEQTSATRRRGRLRSSVRPQQRLRQDSARRGVAGERGYGAGDRAVNEDLRFRDEPIRRVLGERLRSAQPAHRCRRNVAGHPARAGVAQPKASFAAPPLTSGKRMQRA